MTIPLIGVTSSSENEALAYAEAVELAGGSVSLILPEGRQPIEGVLRKLGGLILTGGPDIHPRFYNMPKDQNAGLRLFPSLDEKEIPILKAALDRDMPVLALCRGMQLLNVVLGGRLIQDIPGHKGECKDSKWVPVYHRIYIAPGSKLAAILGAGGFVRVNSLHHQGFREAQKSPYVLASAYSIEDGLIEGIESPKHSWVVGVQCHPERKKENPPHFQNLFLGLVERAETYSQRS